MRPERWRVPRERGLVPGVGMTFGGVGGLGGATAAVGVGSCRLLAEEGDNEALLSVATGDRFEIELVKESFIRWSVELSKMTVSTLSQTELLLPESSLGLLDEFFKKTCERGGANEERSD